MPSSAPTSVPGGRPEIASSVVTGGFTTNYHDLGSGDPVVMLHGSGPGVSAWANWNLTFPLLSDAFHLYAPDLAGFGYTERVPGTEYTLNGWVRQVVDFFDALGIAKAHLVGNSFGGALALALAVTHPERIDRLVLMGAAGVSFPITYGLDRVWGYEPSLATMEELLDIFTYDHSFITPELVRSRYENSIQPGFHETYATMFPAPRQQAVEKMAGHETYLRDITHQTLIIHGLQDRVVPVSNSLRMLELIPDAQLHVFGRCGHWTQIEHTVEFCQLVRNFFTHDR